MSHAPHGPAPDASFALTAEGQRLVRLAGGTLAVLGACSLAGVAASLYLVNNYPLLLVALSPIGRHLVLVAPITDPMAFVGVAVLRRMAFYMASFHLGRGLGPPGLVWIEARARLFGRFVRWLERIFQRWGRLVVFLGAGPTVSALAGIYGMRARVFAALAVPGLVLRVLFILWFAESLRGPIEVLLAWIDAHWVPGTVVMVIAVGAYHLWQVRKARRESLAASDPPA